MRTSPFALLLLGLFLATLILPFVLRREEERPAADGLPLVIISPHNEAIRYEFGLAFSHWHQRNYGRPVNVDWRNVGGTTEIARYLASQYAAAFRARWVGMGREWTSEVAFSFNNPETNPSDPSLPSPVREARAAFLGSDVGVGIDLFFGGGTYDHSRQAAMGHSVPCRYRDTAEGRATLGTQIPETIAGERWYDGGDRWYGVTVSSFGICYNTDSLARLPGARAPEGWRDLGQPALLGQVALADPSKSGSIAKAFEMVIQQEMARAVDGLAPDSPEYPTALGRGWAEGLNVIRRAAANARYFTDSASRVPLDVAQGDAAAGMCIDFYGLFQAAAVARPDGTSRMRYLSPKGGTTVSADPIAMLRGAPHRETAQRFIRFVLSPEGQRLWAFRPGTPGGPERYSLHRLPIRRDFYVPENRPYRTEPNRDPYLLAETFTYHTEWTGPLFGGMRLLIRTMCIDTREELQSAWQAIVETGGPESCPEAMAALSALPESAEFDRLPDTLAGLTRKIDEVRQSRRWGIYFAEQYRRARDLAGHRGKEPA